MFNNKLYLYDLINNEMHYTSSSDGVNFASQTSFNEYADTPPALAILNNNLLLSFASNDPSHDLWLQESTNGKTFQPAQELPIHLGGTPGLVTESSSANGPWLMVAFQANDSGHHLCYVTFNSPVNGEGYSRQDNAQIGSTPAEVIFTPTSGPFAYHSTLFVSFQANDSNHHLWLGGQEVSTFSATN